MRYKTYQEHLDKWNNARKIVGEHNEELIRQWESIPWYRFWEKPSFEQQRQIIINNWAEFNKLPTPLLRDYYPMNI